MNYSSKISLVKNGRGIYCLDTIMGCESGMKEDENGCYNDCYAARAAKRYGIDFTKSINRSFVSNNHRAEILRDIGKINMPFIRIGCSGDPSEDWPHTISIIEKIKGCNKEIIIITRHWNILSDEQLTKISKMNICINTSISSLDRPEILSKCLNQYNRLKEYCKSVLRIISCNFNEKNTKGKTLGEIQRVLFKNDNTIDTVFRPSKNNNLVLSGVINVKNEIFNGKKQLASKLNKKTYMGKCSNCREMCGYNFINNINNTKENPLIKQLYLI